MIKLEDEELVLASEVVARCKIIKKESFWNEKKNFISTKVLYEVVEGLKGFDKAQSEEIIIPGGKVGDVELIIEDMPRFTEGEQVLLFLGRNKKGARFIMGAKQGKKVLNSGLDSALDDGSNKVVEKFKKIIREQGK